MRPHARREEPGLPSRVLERLVAARNQGESPPEVDDPTALAPALRTLVARMESSDYDMLRVALAAMRAELDADTDERSRSV